MTTMKILIAQNRYRLPAPSGEDAVLDQASSTLSARVHVVLFQRHSEEIAIWSPLRRATLPVPMFWNEQSRRSITDSLLHSSPDAGISCLRQIYRFAVENPVEGAGPVQHSASRSGRSPSEVSL
jgi:hypothetical protein